MATSTDSLTDEQRALWNELGWGPPIEAEGVSAEQARDLRVSSFRYACALEGIERPSAEAILAEIDRSVS